MSSVQTDFRHYDTEENRKTLIEGTLQFLYNDNELQPCTKAKVLERLREVLAENAETQRFWCTAVAKCKKDADRWEQIQEVYMDCRTDTLMEIYAAGVGSSSAWPCSEAATCKLDSAMDCD